MRRLGFVAGPTKTTIAASYDRPPQAAQDRIVAGKTQLRFQYDSSPGSRTQVIDRLTVAQLIYEYGSMQGYLSSPYRFVGIGVRGEPFTGTCKSAMQFSLTTIALPWLPIAQAVIQRAQVRLRGDLSPACTMLFQPSIVFHEQSATATPATA